METQIQKYLDSALAVLNKYGIGKNADDSQLATILQDVASVDEPKVLAIAKTVEYMSTFNEFVRDHVQEMNVADRYNQITALFDSIRDDSKTLVKQLDDGKIDLKEKVQNLWMKLARGTPHARFEKIRELYSKVSKDTKQQLETETAIMNSYMDFRFALKEAEGLAYQVLQKQEVNLKNSQDALKSANDNLSAYTGTDKAEMSRLQLARDEAARAQSDEDRKYQLIKDVAENLTVGYNVGDTLVGKLKQTHDLKEQVYRKSVTFFTTNEHVFTVMDAVYTSQHGLNETTSTLEAMKTGANKGLEDIAELSGKLETAALNAGYGSTISPQSVQKLVDSIVNYQLESRQRIKELREESTKSAEQIRTIVDDGKRKVQQAITNYSAK